MGRKSKPLTILNPRPKHHSRITRRTSQVKRRRFAETPSLRHRLEARFVGADLLGECTLSGAEDSVADLEARSGFVVCRDAEDHAGEFGAADPWEGRLL